MNKIAVYSANFGDYDLWQEPKYVNKDYDYYLFTDNVAIESKAYNVLYMNEPEDPCRKARYYKIIEGYDYLCRKGYNVIIWHDSSMQQLRNLDDLLHGFRLMTLLKHPTRDCVYYEFHACCDAYPPKDNVSVMYKQIQGYADNGYPEHNGLAATGVIIRRNHPAVRELCLDWWNEVDNGSIRDQLSFDYVAWVRDFKYQTLPFYKTLSKYFKIKKHIKK